MENSWHHANPIWNCQQSPIIKCECPCFIHTLWIMKPGQMVGTGICVSPSISPTPPVYWGHKPHCHNCSLQCRGNPQGSESVFSAWTSLQQKILLHSNKFLVKREGKPCPFSMKFIGKRSVFMFFFFIQPTWKKSDIPRVNPWKKPFFFTLFSDQFHDSGRKKYIVICGLVLSGLASMGSYY